MKEFVNLFKAQMVRVNTTDDSPCVQEGNLPWTFQ